MVMDIFIKELQKSKKTTWEKTSQEIGGSKKINQGFGFHLRNTGLDFTDTQIFANAMQKVSRRGFVLEII